MCFKYKKAATHTRQAIPTHVERQRQRRRAATFAMRISVYFYSLVIRWCGERNKRTNKRCFAHSMCATRFFFASCVVPLITSYIHIYIIYLRYLMPAALCNSECLFVRCDRTFIQVAYDGLWSRSVARVIGYLLCSLSQMHAVVVCAMQSPLLGLWA